MLNIRLAGNEFTVTLQAANAELQAILCEDLAGEVPDVLYQTFDIKNAFRPLCFELGITGKCDQRMNVFPWNEIQKLLNSLDVLVVLA